MDSNVPHDAAFEAVPVGSTFFLIWRIKEFKLVPVPKANYGNFFKGDSYILICCCEDPKSAHSQMESKPLTKANRYIDIHFWIGSNSSQDEAGTAAIKSVELDDYLGGIPIQHREAEGHESKQFLSYFKSGIRLLNGGFESGFQKVEDELKPALLQVKGKKRPVVHQTDKIGWSSINNGDVFLLMVPNFIFVWTGKFSNRMERIAAIRIANELKNENSRFHLSVVVLDDGKEQEQMSGPETKEFENFLPLSLKDKELKQTTDADCLSDEKFEAIERQSVELLRCQENELQIEVVSIKKGLLTRLDLDSNDTFVINNGPNGIWVWVGKKATKKERSSALKYAMELIKKKNYSSNTQVTKVIEEGEPAEFKSLFKTWAITAEDKRNHARLCCLLRSGNFSQIAQFDKDDLEEDNIMILDAIDKLYIWVGSDLEDKYTDEAKLNKVFQMYMQQDKSGRTLSKDQVTFVRQGKEDSTFNSYFK